MVVDMPTGWLGRATSEESTSIGPRSARNLPTPLGFGHCIFEIRRPSNSARWAGGWYWKRGPDRSDRARIEIKLEESPSGTRITMSEEAISPLWARWSSPLIAPVLHIRNVEALRRFAVLFDGPDLPHTKLPEGRPQGRGDGRDPVEAALDAELADSFPASDPPSSWGGTT